MGIKRKLILSHFCLQSSSFASRVAAAKIAGCSGIGLWISEYEKLRQSGMSDNEMKTILDDHDIGLPEIEVLTGWGGDEREREQSKKMLEIACHMADQFGSQYLQVIGPYSGSLTEGANRLKEVCDKAACHGLEVSLEFLPGTNISNLSDARQIISLVDCDNIGICLDSWHFFRGDNDLAELATLGSAEINLLQMNDGKLQAEDDHYIRDCLTNRRLFGEGEFPLESFMEEINGIGYEGPVSIEIMSTRLEAQPANDVALAMTSSFRRFN